MHALDRLLCKRCLALALALHSIVAALVVMTDEPGSTLALRLARLGALAPAVVVVAEGVALAQSHARGEQLALAALGTSPFRAARGAMLAGWLVGALSLALLLSPLSDVRSLFPTVTAPSKWVAAGLSLWDPQNGATVAPDGRITLAPVEVRPPDLPGPGRAAALFAIAPLALIVPAWGAAPLSLAARALGAVMAAALLIALLHAAAAGRIASGILPLAVLPLIVQASIAFGRRQLA